MGPGGSRPFPCEGGVPDRQSVTGYLLDTNILLLAMRPRARKGSRQRCELPLSAAPNGIEVLRGLVLGGGAQSNR